MSCKFVDSFRAGTGLNIVVLLESCYKPVWHKPLLSVQWVNSWWWTKELPETCRVSCQNKFVILVHLVGFIVRKFVTMHGHMSRCTVTCHDAWSRVTMHGHVSRCTVTCHDARSRERNIICMYLTRLSFCEIMLAAERWSGVKSLFQETWDESYLLIYKHKPIANQFK